MNEQAAFTRAICESPDDDTARLVYADWLQENGQGRRQEFIRLQILLHHTPFIRKGGSHAKWPEPWASHVNRSHELAEVYGATWAGAARQLVPEMPSVMWHSWYDRGFVGSVSCGPPDEFKRLASAIFAESPVTLVFVNAHPFRPDVRGPWLYQRGGATRFSDSSHLPEWLFDLLPEEGRVKGYRYTADAVAALRAVLVDYGRELAGLPPLVRVPA